uniref:Uncharacterized protein n=1 Tax=Strongyloides papillosus TaxID=174720 RepID=A0A0N5BGA1_STREA
MTLNGVYEKFIKYMISRLGNNNIQSVKNEMEGRSLRQLPLETLPKMDEELTHALQWNVTSMSRSVSQTPERNQSLNFASVPRDSSSSLGSVGSDAFKDCIEALNLIIGDISTKTSPQENNDEVQIGGGRPKKGVKFNKEIEPPILELLY